MPSNSGTVYASATLNGWPVNAITGQVLGSNGVAYITAQTPQQTVGAVIPGLQAVAASPDGRTLYGVNTQQNLLVVANAADLTQRQTFQDGFAQAPSGNQTVGTTVSMPNPVAVAVSPDGNNVYVASGSGDQITIFSRSSNGDLVYQGAQSVSSGIGSLTSLAVSGSSAGSDRVFVGGSGGVAEFQGDTTANTLSFLQSNMTIGSISGLAISRDGSLLYAVSASNDALYVLNTSGLSSVGTYTTTSLTAANPTAPSNTLEGASGVAVSQNDESVYVIGGSSGTLTVFQRNTTTNALTWRKRCKTASTARAAWPVRPPSRSRTTASMSTSPAARTARWPSMGFNPTARWCSTRSCGASPASTSPPPWRSSPPTATSTSPPRQASAPAPGDWPPSRQSRPRRRTPSP